MLPLCHIHYPCAHLVTTHVSSWMVSNIPCAAYLCVLPQLDCVFSPPNEPWVEAPIQSVPLMARLTITSCFLLVLLLINCSSLLFAVLPHLLSIPLHLRRKSWHASSWPLRETVFVGRLAKCQVRMGFVLGSCVVFLLCISCLIIWSKWAFPQEFSIV